MTMNWEEDVSEGTRKEFMRNGAFTPDELTNELCGYEYGPLWEKDSRLSVDDLRRRAAACIEAADWLDKRAKNGK